MYAIVRYDHYEPGRLAEATDALARSRKLHTAQAGYAGSLVVEIRPGESLTINLWNSELDAAAGRMAIGGEVNRIMSGILVAPSEVLGVGNVVATDLTLR